MCPGLGGFRQARKSRCLRRHFSHGWAIEAQMTFDERRRLVSFRANRKVKVAQDYTIDAWVSDLDTELLEAHAATPDRG
jgi:hypothetical protein